MNYFNLTGITPHVMPTQTQPNPLITLCGDVEDFIVKTLSDHAHDSIKALHIPLDMDDSITRHKLREWLESDNNSTYQLAGTILA